jgi:hypothetical protein
MRYAISLNFEGTAVVEPDADGCHALSLAGNGKPPESTDQWQISMGCRWPEEGDGTPEAELLLTGPLGGRIRGSVRGRSLDAITDGAGMTEGQVIDVQFAITDGTGAFQGTSGTARLHGTVLPQGFLLTADLDIEANDDAWVPPSAERLSPAEDAAGGSHVGPQPLSQKQAEADAEARLVRRMEPPAH